MTDTASTLQVSVHYNLSLLPTFTTVNEIWLYILIFAGGRKSAQNHVCQKIPGCLPKLSAMDRFLLVLEILLLK